MRKQAILNTYVWVWVRMIAYFSCYFKCYNFLFTSFVFYCVLDKKSFQKLSLQNVNLPTLDYVHLN